MTSRDELATRFAIELVVIALLVGLLTGLGREYVPLNVLVIALLVGTIGLVVLAFRLFHHVDELVTNRVEAPEPTPEAPPTAADSTDEEPPGAEPDAAEDDDTDEEDSGEAATGFEWGTD